MNSNFKTQDFDHFCNYVQNIILNIAHSERHAGNYKYGITIELTERAISEMAEGLKPVTTAAAPKEIQGMRFEYFINKIRQTESDFIRQFGKPVHDVNKSDQYNSIILSVHEAFNHLNNFLKKHLLPLPPKLNALENWSAIKKEAETIWLPAYCKRSQALRTIEETKDSPNTNLLLDLIAAELKPLEDFREKVSTLVRDRVIDLDNEKLNSNYSEEIIYLRLTANYYEKRTATDNYNLAKHYARHFLFKEQLERAAREVNSGITLTATQSQKKAMQKQNGKFSYPAIAFAYCVKGELINDDNARKILTKHSNYNSVGTLFKYRTTNKKGLLTVDDNKTAATKKLNALRAAERLLKGEKNNEAVKDIQQIIHSYITTYDKKFDL